MSTPQPFIPPNPGVISWAGWLQFLQNQVMIPAADLPPMNNNLVIDSSGGNVIDSSGNTVTSNPAGYPPQAWALAFALEIVSEYIAAASCLMYVRAVYCLAADRLINFGADQPQQTWLATAREQYGITKTNAQTGAVVFTNLAMGVVSMASDNGSATSILNPDQLKGLTIMDLSNLRTPWGREYLAIAQAVGPNLFGVS